MQLKVSSVDTFADQCKQKRRPRLQFNSIKKQLESYCTVIFRGPLDELID